ncbi:MAG: type II secretion system protein M [Phycisphaerales bacterium]|jgi:hypothetical protein|nr:type II secretion system protein M [Phycisphaerales bacterium]
MASEIISTGEGVAAGAAAGAPGGGGWFARLPRSMRWLVWFGVVLVGYFAIVEPVLGYAARVRDRADRLEAALTAQQRLAQERAQAGGVIDRGLAALGLPNMPTSADAAEALNRRIDRISREQNVVIRRRTERPRSPMAGLTGAGGAAASAAPTWNGARLEQVGVEFTIECDTTQLAAVLKALEGSPEIHAVSQVRVQKIVASGGGSGGAKGEDPGLLSVTLLPVTWVLPRGGGGGGGGNATGEAP